MSHNLIHRPPSSNLGIMLLSSSVTPSPLAQGVTCGTLRNEGVGKRVSPVCQLSPFVCVFLSCSLSNHSIADVAS